MLNGRVSVLSKVHPLRPQPLFNWFQKCHSTGRESFNLCSNQHLNPMSTHFPQKSAPAAAGAAPRAPVGGGCGRGGGFTDGAPGSGGKGAGEQLPRAQIPSRVSGEALWLVFVH